METSTIRNIYYLFIIALLVTSDFSYAMGMRQREEPQCNSRFDYEYKVLQKLLELETSQKELQETIKIQQDTIAAQGDTLKDYERSLKETTSSLDEAMVKINETGRELKETVSSLGDARTKINESKHKDMAGAHVGFTVKNQKDNTDPRIFRTVVYNSEPGFNTANGKFVCHHSGMYLFTATVIRSSGTAEVYCWINVNGSDNVLAIASDYRGHHSGSATLVVHLNVGDEVYLAKCKGNMDTSTSFSGALIKPDPN